jgi:hypothetical protein
MNRNAAFSKLVNRRPAAAIALLASGLLLVGLCGSASAKRHPLVGKDNKIHACYRVKGKPKGALRVVRSPRARCRRGERKVAWSVAASTGAVGSTGQAGAGGSVGASGSAGSNEAVLKEQIGALTQRVVTLEGILLGITNEDLTGALATLQGLDNEDLLGAVSAVPMLTSACTTLVEQSNDMAGGVEGLVDVLTGVPLLGDIFDGVEVPTALDPQDTCPEPEL